jgi:hypothetical protein
MRAFRLRRVIVRRVLYCVECPYERRRVRCFEMGSREVWRKAEGNLEEHGWNTYTTAKQKLGQHCSPAGRPPQHLAQAGRKTRCSSCSSWAKTSNEWSEEGSGRNQALAC